MADYKVIINNFTFSPKECSIKKGDKIAWVNEDSTTHTATADNGEFKSGDLEKNDQPFEHEFKQSGEYGYHCEHHRTMKGKIIVE